MDSVEAPTIEGALVPIEGLTALQIFAPGAVDPLLEKIRASVRAVSTDISTPAGRKAIASLAYKVARSKTLLDEMGKELVADWKTKASTVDAERRRIRDELDALRDKVRKPLDDFEEAEKKRIEAHEYAISRIEDLGTFAVSEPSAAAIAERISRLQEPDSRDWQEFAKRAADTRARVIAGLERDLATVEKLEAERAEAERLRAEEAEAARLEAIRLQEEREARIAAEAAEAARLEAERIAQEAAQAEAARVEAERLAAENRAWLVAKAAQEDRDRIECERAEAEARAVKAETDRVAVVERAAADAAEAARKAEEERLASAERERTAAKAAAQAERDRIAAAQKAEDAETLRRLADKAHRRRINIAALDGLVAAGLSEDMAQIAVTAIAKGTVPHITISY